MEANNIKSTMDIRKFNQGVNKDEDERRGEHNPEDIRKKAKSTTLKGFMDPEMQKKIEEAQQYY